MLLSHLAVEGKNTVISLVLNDQAHQIAVDFARPGGKAVNQGCVAQDVDNARDAVAGLRDHFARAVRKQVGT